MASRVATSVQLANATAKNYK